MKVSFSVVSRGLSRASFCVGLMAGMVSLAGCAAGDETVAGGDDAKNPELAQDSAELTRSRVASSAEFARMEQHVAARYEAADVVHSFKLPSGEAVDCVVRERQPSLRGQGRVAIAEPPAAEPSEKLRKSPPEGSAYLNPERTDAQGVKLSCPDGTVPIKKITAADFARFKTVEDRMRKYPSHLGGDVARDPSQEHLFIGEPAASGIHPPAANGPTSLHQYAHARRNQVNVGSSTNISSWNSYTQSNAEFSLGQLWLVKGSGGGLQTLEAGIQKYVDLYGDSNPHLFIYSTSNNYGAGSCYNLDCPRFVQTNNTWVIGGGLVSSVSGGAQYDYEIKYVLSGGNWWLGIEGTWVGYYPGNLFNAAGLANGAAVIDFGGEIIDDRTKHAAHTATDMGSGAYPSSGWTFAAYQRDIRYYSAANTYVNATGLTAYRDSASCYDISLAYNGGVNWNTYFYYGGPGYNTNCQ